MNLFLYCNLLLHILTIFNIKFVIAIEDKQSTTLAITDVKTTDKPIPTETKVIEINLKNDVKTEENALPAIKVEEVSTKPSESTITTNPKEGTIATITVNIPNQDEKKIEIKNVEAPAPEKPKEIPKILPTEEEEEIESSFFQKVLKFIRSDFRFLVKIGAVLSSALNQMIPLNLLLSMRKHRSTKNLKSINFVTSAVSSLLWTLYGTLTRNFIILISNFPGAIINLVAMWMFNKYCTDQSQRFILNISSKIGAGLAVLLIVLYFILSSPTFLTVVGLFGGSLLAISYVSPLVSFNEILESRNTSTMPTEISLGNFISSFFMFCYGFIIWDLLVIAPSFLGVISGLVQLTLLFLFPHSDRIIISEVEILDQPNNFKSILTVDQEV